MSVVQLDQTPVRNLITVVVRPLNDLAEDTLGHGIYPAGHMKEIPCRAKHWDENNVGT